ncbi:MAG: serine/threonine-protein kinase, partial [Polyangia bacterium]
FFLVLEFVDGWSLEQARRRAQKARMKFPLPLALYVVGSLCRALAYVHTRKRRGRPLGIVHRDVTPQNVLLSREGEVKLADFGIAKAIGKTEKSATGVIKGKFAYMSPEQSIGGELDARSDLFSVGTVLYLLATGRKPFEGATDLDVLMQVRKARYEKPSTLVRDFNPEVERFIARALRADRSRRWQSAEQMADRIDAILLKLGQTTGPSALKRWLDNLSAKDGAKPPAEMAEQPSTSGTVELGSRDLELEEVAPSAEATAAAAAAAEAEAECPDEEEAPRRAAGRPPLSPPPPVSALAAQAGSATGTGAVYAAYRVEERPRGTGVSAGSVQSASAAGAVLDDAASRGAAAPPPLRARAPYGRDLRPVAKVSKVSKVSKIATISVMAVALLGGSAYLARQYLFTRWLHPVKSWLQQRLPAPVPGPDWTGDPRSGSP